MNLLICTPAVKSERALRKAAIAGADLVYLTNPLDQKGPAAKAGFTVPMIDDDCLCASNEEMDRLVLTAKRWAREWHQESGLKDLAFYGGVHCSGLVAQSFTVELLKLLKPAHLYMKLLERYPVKKINILGDGPWNEAAMFVARLRGIPVEIISVQDVPGPGDAEPRGAGPTKKILAGMNRLMKKKRRGSVLFSSAPRYALPLLRRGDSCYLREAFSAKMFMRSLAAGFVHLVPEYYADRGLSVRRAEAAELFFKEAEAYFSGRPFFEWEGENLWPLVRACALRLTQTEMVRCMELVDRFCEMFRTIAPRAVVVDEEVCFFNKTLVLTANALGIPTLALVHGEPYDDMGSIPSSVSRVLAWGPSTSKRLEAWGVDPAKIAQVGAPQFTLFDAAHARRIVARRFGIPGNATLALFGAFAFETNERVTLLRVSQGMALQEKSLAALLEALKRHPRLHLIVKFHPYEKHISFTEGLVKAAGQSVASRVRLVRDYDAARLIAAADAVFTIMSTMYAETMLSRKPVLAFTDRASSLMSSGQQWSVDIRDTAGCADAIDACLDPSRVRDIQSRIDGQIAEYFIDENRNAISHTLRAIEEACLPSREEMLHA